MGLIVTCSIKEKSWEVQKEEKIRAVKVPP